MLKWFKDKRPAKKHEDTKNKTTTTELLHTSSEELAMPKSLGYLRTLNRVNTTTDIKGLTRESLSGKIDNSLVRRASGWLGSKLINAQPYLYENLQRKINFEVHQDTKIAYEHLRDFFSKVDATNNLDEVYALAHGTIINLLACEITKDVWQFILIGIDLRLKDIQASQKNINFTKQVYPIDECLKIVNFKRKSEKSKSTDSQHPFDALFKKFIIKLEIINVIPGNDKTAIYQKVIEHFLKVIRKLALTTAETENLLKKLKSQAKLLPEEYLADMTDSMKQIYLITPELFFEKKSHGVINFCGFRTSDYDNIKVEKMLGYGNFGVVILFSVTDHSLTKSLKDKHLLKSSGMPLIACKSLLPQSKSYTARLEFENEVYLNLLLWKKYHTSPKDYCHVNLALPAKTQDNEIILISVYENCGSLSQLINNIRQRRDFDEKATIDFFSKCVHDIWLGIGQLHDSGVFHGDLSCDNILVHKDEYGTYQCKVADLGLSREFDANSPDANVRMQSDCKMQTARVDYERRRHHLLSAKTDIYSYKVCVLEILLNLSGNTIKDMLKHTHREMEHEHDDVRLKYLFDETEKMISASKSKNSDVCLGLLKTLSPLFNWNKDLSPSGHIEDTNDILINLMNNLSDLKLHETNSGKETLSSFNSSGSDEGSFVDNSVPNVYMDCPLAISRRSSVLSAKSNRGSCDRAVLFTSPSNQSSNDLVGRGSFDVILDNLTRRKASTGAKRGSLNPTVTGLFADKSPSSSPIPVRKRGTGSLASTNTLRKGSI